MFFDRFTGIEKQIDISKDWNTIKDEKDIKLMYKEGSDSGKKLITMFINAMIPCPIYNLLVLLYELDLYHNFVPFCSESKELEKLGRTFKLGYLKFNIGPFFLKREAIITGFGWDRLFHKGYIAIDVKSVQADDEALQVLESRHPIEYKNTSIDIDPCFV